MTAILNFLNLVQNNWTIIAAILVEILAIGWKVKNIYEDWQNKSDEEKQAEVDRQIEKAKEALKEVVLSLVSEAELQWNYEGSEKLGSIKRSQVIEEIYKTYPILLQVIDQDELVKYIDKLIDEALVTVREKIRTA